MNLFIGEQTITLNFGVEPNRHCLFINVEEDRLYLDGSRLLTTKKEFDYTKGLMFQKNAIRKKVRIKTISFAGKILGIDVGPDGRVFFKFFARETYSLFRGKPLITYSYWHCRREGLKKFYEGNLSEPSKVWPVEYKNEILS